MKFNDVVAVNKLSTTIRDGELVSLLGPSGCGKSTTLMLLSGLYKPTAGQIIFGDRDVTKIEAEKREIGMVFQNYALYPHLTVLKNIMFPLKMMKVNKKEAEERAMDMAKLVQIDHLAHRKPGQLSGGQQQRVAIARALVKKPKLLLLDEPLSNLDARLRLEMREEIRRIQQEVGITAVFVTHDQEEALSISDRVMLMSGGILQQDASPQGIYHEPVTSFVAKFIGNPPINLMTATSHEGMRARIDGYESSIKLPGQPKSLPTNIELGMRPEDFYVTDQEHALVSGEVTYYETVGRDTMIRVQCGGQDLRALIDPEAEIKVGDLIHLNVRRNRIYVFDQETGKVCQ